MTFGRSTSNEVILEQIHYSKSGTRINFRHENQAAAVVLPAYLPMHFGSSLAAALTVFVAKGYSLSQGCDILTKQFMLPPGRMSVFQGIRGSTIIDSSYNASAGPMMDALSMMAELHAKRRLALLGDMRELGEEAETEHVKVMAVAIKRVDKVYLVGPLMKQFAVPYLKQHRFPFEWYPTAHLAGKALKEYVITGDVILIKGSQNTLYLETAVALLLADKKDIEKLCRRGKYWDKIRKQNDTFSR
jgi:UDP-N-acetylmuramoyl-tripeptide--D-alanyl-D-alanine ligase